MEKNLSLQLSTIVKQSPKQVNTDLDGDTIIMNIDNGVYFSLDDISTKIWDLISEPNSISQVCEKLIKTYDVSMEQCEKQVIAFFNDLSKEGLLSIEAWAE